MEEREFWYEYYYYWWDIIKLDLMETGIGNVKLIDMTPDGSVSVCLSVALIFFWATYLVKKVCASWIVDVRELYVIIFHKCFSR